MPKHSIVNHQSSIENRFIRITEVGPRDGLQNESKTISTDAKVTFVDLLSATGVAEIEVSSFVSPKWIPQLGDAAEVFKRIKRRDGVVYSALVPNEKGLEGALEADVDKIAVFTAASETFSRKNTNATIAETLERFRPVIARAKTSKRSDETSKRQNVKTSQQSNTNGASPLDVSTIGRFDVSHSNVSLPVRAYISCAIACPYEGPIDPKEVRDLAAKVLDLGADEIDLGDTIGVAVPTDIEKLYDALDGLLRPDQTTLHLHDTRGTALACAKRAFELGVRSFDSSCAGLGGCPFAPGAAGNVATGDLVSMFREMRCDTGVDFPALTYAGLYISKALERPLLKESFKADGHRT